MTADRYALDCELFDPPTARVTNPASPLFELGWSPIPLEAGTKWPPPPGVTGYRGRYLTAADIAGHDWTGNVAIRLPLDVAGVDVDVYNGGSDGLADLERKYGTLPQTVMSTSRDDGSGIRLFRVPARTTMRTDPAAGIDMIQWFHRYMLCRPSIHDKSGLPYRWVDEQSGDVLDYPPEPGELPELPWGWITGLAVAKEAGADAATPEVCDEFITGHTANRFPEALKGIRKLLDTCEPGKESRGRHDTLIRVGCMAMREADAGYYPAGTVVDLLDKWWKKVHADEPLRRDSGEFGGGIAYAIGQLDTDKSRTRVDELRDKLDPLGPYIANGNEPPPGVDPATGEILQPVGFPTMRIVDMALEVDNSPRPRYVVRRLLTEADYGVLGAAKKFGKTWTMTELGVVVPAGGSFLGRYPVDVAGPVLMFAGEGGRRKIVRRCRAVAAFYGIDLDDLDLHVYERAPKLADLQQVARLAATVAQIAPVLTIVDPAYLAIAGADTPNLASMGVLLERVQIITQDAGSALLMSHHWNKTGSGTTADRFTGSGWAEWGRVLISGSTLSHNVDRDTGMSTNVCKLEVIGDEIADTEIIYRRRVWVDNLDDLTSTMHYTVEVIDEPDTDDTIQPAELAGLKPAAVRVLKVLRAHPGCWLDHVQIGDALAVDGLPLRKRTILEAGQALVTADLAGESGGIGGIRKTFRAHLEAENGF